LNVLLQAAADKIEDLQKRLYSYDAQVRGLQTEKV